MLRCLGLQLFDRSVHSAGLCQVKVFLCMVFARQHAPQDCRKPSSKLPNARKVAHSLMSYAANDERREHVLQYMDLPSCHHKRSYLRRAGVHLREPAGMVNAKTSCRGAACRIVSQASLQSTMQELHATANAHTHNALHRRCRNCMRQQTHKCTTPSIEDAGTAGDIKHTYTQSLPSTMQEL